MQVILGEIHPFPNTRADEGQAAKILEEAAEVFCAWQEYDRCLNGNDLKPAISRNWHREHLLNECADLIMACENMLAGVDTRRKSEFECEAATLTKEYVRQVLVLSSVVHHLSCKWSVAKASFYRSDLRDNVRTLEELACSIVAALGVTDFRPYMEACEQRNRERGRYER